MVDHDRREIDALILKDLSRTFNPSRKKDLMFIKYLLVNSCFACKDELIEFLLSESKKTGYSILRRLLWA